MEATGVDLATIAWEALAGQSLAALAHTIQTISLLVRQRACRARQGNTVVPLDSQRQLISVPMDTFAQLAHQALNLRLVFVLLVRHAQPVRSLLLHVLQGRISLSGARPPACLARLVTDAAQLSVLENVGPTITAHLVPTPPFYAQQERTPKRSPPRRHMSAHSVPLVSSAYLMPPRMPL
jgi:hypothetical protein